MSYVLTINFTNNNGYLSIASADAIDRRDMELFMDDCEEDAKLKIRSRIPIPADIIKALKSRYTPSGKVFILERKDVLSMSLSIF